VAAEYRSPRRDVPLATGIAVAVVGVLYLGLAATTVLVLGPAAATSNAPLSDLMALAIGDGARVATAGVAVLLSIGAMNAYFAGSAKLGSALGRDGALPSWFAAGSGVGEVPRRSLAVVTGLACVTLGITAVLGMELDFWLLLATSAFGIVYVLGTAAAVRLLPPGWARRGAVVAVFASVALTISIGLPMLWALGVSAVALAYMSLGERRSRADAHGRP
jgi:amino acid efflux transporter